MTENRRGNPHELSYANAQAELDPYARVAHVVYKMRARRLPEQLNDTGYLGKIQFKIGEEQSERIVMASMVPYVVRTSEGLSAKGCSELTVATVPATMADHYKSNFIGFGGLFSVRFTGLPETFDDTTDYALGLEFDREGRAGQVSFKGTLDNRVRHVTYTDPITYNFNHYDRTIEVRDSQTSLKTTARKHVHDAKGSLIPKDRENHLGISVESEMRLILRNLSQVI